MTSGATATFVLSPRLRFANFLKNQTVKFRPIAGRQKTTESKYDSNNCTPTDPRSVHDSIFGKRLRSNLPGITGMSGSDIWQWRNDHPSGHYFEPDTRWTRISI
jgi:hypothetical protein